MGGKKYMVGSFPSQRVERGRDSKGERGHSHKNPSSSREDRNQLKMRRGGARCRKGFSCLERMRFEDEEGKL